MLGALNRFLRSSFGLSVCLSSLCQRDMKTFQNKRLTSLKEGCLRGVISLAWKWQRSLLGGVPPEQSKSESGNWDWEIEEGCEPLEVRRDRDTGGTSVSLVAQLCPTLCNPMDCSMAGFPVHHQLPELAQTHIHRVGDVLGSQNWIWPCGNLRGPYTLLVREGCRKIYVYVQKHFSV